MQITSSTVNDEREKENVVLTAKLLGRNVSGLSTTIHLSMIQEELQKKKNKKKKNEEKTKEILPFGRRSTELDGALNMRSILH